MTQAEFRDKFRLLASVNLAPERIEAIMAAVDSVEQAPECRELLGQVLSA
jgi:hypothetical protein